VEYEAIDLGAIYRATNTTRLGIMFKNIVGFSFKDEYKDFKAPKYFTLALSHTMGPTTLALDSEYIFGEFGGVEKESANIWFLRGGLEHRANQHLRLRAGLAYPVVASTTASGDIKNDIPWPGIGGSLGLGWAFKRFDLDLALYGDSARSYVEQALKMGAAATLTFKF
jgi:long-subunit fatty acid transport protein